MTTNNKTIIRFFETEERELTQEDASAYMELLKGRSWEARHITQTKKS